MIECEYLKFLDSVTFEEYRTVGR